MMLSANVRNNNDDPLILDLAFKSELSKEEEDAVLLKKAAKSLGVFFSIGVTIPYIFSYVKYRKTCDTSWEGALVIETIATYATIAMWFFLNLEKIFLSDQYPEQKIVRENTLFTIAKHFFSTGLPMGIVISAGMAPTMYSYMNNISNIMFSGLVNSYFFYVAFNHFNSIQSIFSKKTASSLKTAQKFSYIIEQVTPVLLKVSMSEKKGLIPEVYNSTKNQHFFLMTALKEFKKLISEETMTFKPHEEWKKSLSYLATSFSLVFNTTLAFVLLDYYNHKVDMKYGMTAIGREYCYFSYCFNYDDDDYYYNCYTGYRSGAIFTIATCAAPSILLTKVAAEYQLNRFLAMIYNKDASDFVAHFHPKASYFILAIAYIASGLLLVPFFTNVTTTHPIDFSYFGKKYLSYEIFFASTFYLCFVPFFFDVVGKSLMTNYCELYGNPEQKDAIRLLKLLEYLQNTLAKARPELIDARFNHTQGKNELLELGIIETAETKSTTFRNSFGIKNFGKNRHIFMGISNRDDSFGGPLSDSKEAEHLLSNEEKGEIDVSGYTAANSMVEEYPREKTSWFSSCAMM